MKKKLELSLYSFTASLLLLVALFLVNSLAGYLNLEFDVSDQKIYSVSNTTRKIVGELSNELNIYAVYPYGNESEVVRESLKAYEYISKKIKIRYVDPELEPALLEKFKEPGKTIANGSLIVEYGTQFRIISPGDLYIVDFSQQNSPVITGFSLEKKVTGAIQYLSQGRSFTVYELTGHGEDSLSVNGFEKNLEDNNIQVKQLQLLQVAHVPGDCDVLSIISPNFDLNPAEGERIREFMNRGGKLFVAMDYGKENFPVIQNLLYSLGLSIDMGIVMESDSSYYTGIPFYLNPVLQSHPVTNPLIQEKIRPVFPFCVDIRKADIVPDRYVLTSIARSSSFSWLRKNDRDVDLYRKSGEVEGPFVSAWAISPTDEKSDFRALILSTAKIFGPVGPYGVLKSNTGFLLNGFNWLIQRETGNTIESKSFYQFPLRINQTIVIIYGIITVFVFPIGLLISGFVVWLRRKGL